MKFAAVLWIVHFERLYYMRRYKMDYYKCDKCGRIFDEFELDFNFAQEKSITLCRKCKKEYQCKVDKVLVEFSERNKA